MNCVNSPSFSSIVPQGIPSRYAYRWLEVVWGKDMNVKHVPGCLMARVNELCRHARGMRRQFRTEAACLNAAEVLLDEACDRPDREARRTAEI